MIKYKEGYKFVLAEDYRVKISIKPNEMLVVDNVLELHPDGTLLIKKGYAWDGASGPAINTKDIMRGALVHDALYQLMREGHLSQTYFDSANKALRDICIEDGMSKLRAWYIYKAVSIFGKKFTEPSIGDIKTAP